MLIRQVTEYDAEQLTALMIQLTSESSFMLYEHDEVPKPSSLAKRIALANQSECIWVAEENDAIMGYLGLSLGKMKRNCGVGTLALGVADTYSGKGVGSTLITHAITEAMLMDLYRLQLYVQTTNLKAIRLYKRFAFEIEGTIRSATKIDGCLVDKFIMAKLL